MASVLPARGTKRRGAPTLAARHAPEGDSRAVLLAAASAVMVETNSIEVSVHDVAGRAKLNTALIRYYFGNKQGLLLALVLRDVGPSMVEMTRLLERDITASAKMRLHIVGIINTLARFPYLIQLILFLQHDEASTECQEVTRSFVLPLIEFQRAVIRAGQASGEFRDDVDEMSFYFSAIGACEHFFFARSARRSFGALDVSKELRDRYSQQVGDLLLGWLKRP